MAEPEKVIGGSEIQQIVELMNKYLNTKYTAVEFDSLKGLTLLQRLNDVLALLQPSMNVDIAQEQATTGNMQATTQRMSEFLFTILNYKLPNSLRQDYDQNFANGERTLIYPILHWLLTHMPQNHKRVYLSKYLIPVEVPEDLRASDEGVREVFNQYKGLIDEFIQTHRSVEKLKENVADPQEIGKQIKTMEQERETLKHKITTTKDKLKQYPQWENLLKAAQNLRSEQEDQMKHNEQLESQSVALLQAEKKLAGADQKLKELKRDVTAGSVNEMIQKMQDDIRMHKMLLNEKLPKDIEAKSHQLRLLNEVMNEPPDTSGLQQEIAALEAEIQELQSKKDEMMKDKDAQQLQMFRQQATLTANRKAAFLQELQSVKDETAKVKQDIARKEEDLGRFSNQKILKGDDFVKYGNSLRGKSAKFKKLKAELGDLRAEFGVLQRTQEILKTKVDMKEYLGLLQTKNQLDEVTQQKLGVDEEKTETLEQLSSVVQEFVSKAKDKRIKLSPQFLELRNTRQKSQVVEQEYQQKKEAYEAEQERLEAVTGKLQDEVDHLQNECRLCESLYHRLNVHLSIVGVARRRVQDEVDFVHGDRKLDDKYDTWNAMFEAKIKELEAHTQEARLEKKDTEANHDQNLRQMEWFRNLQKLLECKLNYYKREMTEKKGDVLAGDMVMGGGGNMANVMVL